jgi:hypothetical protein
MKPLEKYLNQIQIEKQKFFMFVREIIIAQAIISNISKEMYCGN